MREAVAELPDAGADATQPGQAWLEVREGALGWIAADRPDWWHNTRPEPNVARIIADTGLARKALYRFRDLQGVPGPAGLEAISIGGLVAVGASARGVDDQTAFDSLFKVVRPALAVAS